MLILCEPRPTPFIFWFQVSLGGMLLALNKGDKDEFLKLLGKARQDIMGPLSAASMESYQRAYPFLTKLHMLRELEQSMPLFHLSEKVKTEKEKGTVREDTSEDIQKDWSIRLKMTQPSFRTREPILNLRRAVFELHAMHEGMASSWLHIAKTARAANQFQTAETAIMRARLESFSSVSSLPPPSLLVGLQKLLY